jgi:hypothetical protein
MIFYAHGRCLRIHAFSIHNWEVVEGGGDVTDKDGLIRLYVLEFPREWSTSNNCDHCTRGTCVVLTR